MDSKAVLSFEEDVVPALKELGATVQRVHVNPANGVLKVVIVLADYSWSRRREVLDTITGWQNGFAEDVDVEPAILAESDLTLTEA